jgi:co-chaperonin GroES (HSP10)
MLVKDGYSTDTEENLFPEIKPGISPFGSRVLVQIRRARTKSKGGIIFSESTKDTELDNTCVAKVLSVGPLAYKNRNTLEPWSEGVWCQAGQYVFVPKYGGIRWERAFKDGKDDLDQKVQFAIFDDLNIIGDVEDPFEIKAFI